MKYLQDKIYYLVVVVSVLLYSSFGTVKETNIRCEKDVTAVYSVIIDSVEQNMQQGTSKYDEIAVIDSTESFSFGRYFTTPDSIFFVQNLSEMTPPTFQNFLDRNIESKFVSDLSNLNPDERMPCNRDDPDARCLRFSDVGFDTSCSQALVSYVYVCGRGSKCGYKKFVLLTKKKGQWTIQDHFISYII